MSEVTYEVDPTTDVRTAPAREPLFRRIWPAAAIAFGLGLTAAWMCFLGYGLVKLVEIAI